MTCRDLAELITDHLEGRLSFGERVRFQLHLGICHHCRTYLKQMRGMIRKLGKLGEQGAPLPPPSAEVQAELVARFRNFQRAKKEAK